MRLDTNKEMFSYRRFTTLKRAIRPVSLIKLSHHPIKHSTIHYQRDRPNVFSKKHQIKAIPLPCNYCSKSNSQGRDEKQVKTEKVGNYQKFKTMFKEYWHVLVPVHLVTSCFWFGSFYYMAASGVDIPAVLESLGAPETWIEKFKNTKAGNLFIAYTLYKVVTPLRYTVTVGGTTISIQYLKQWGWIKPVPNKEQLKKMYQEQKDVLKDFRASCQDKMQVTKTEFNKSKDEMKKHVEVAKEAFHNSMKDTRDGLKEGIKGGTEEWKMLLNSVKREIKENFGNSKNQKNN